MAITTIDNLQEIQTAGENDVLPISTDDGVKKIKASALGGGGAENVVATFSNDGSSLTCDTSIADMITAFNGGSNIIGKLQHSSSDYMVASVCDIGKEHISFMFSGTMGGTSAMLVLVNGAIGSGGTESWSYTAYQLTPVQ